MTSSSTTATVIVHIVAGDKADTCEVEEATLSLMRDLEDSDLAESMSRQTAAAPSGAKAGEVLTAATVILTVLPAAVEQLLGLLRDWVGRPGNLPVKLKVSCGDRSIEAEFDPRRLPVENMESLIGKMNFLLKD